MWSDKQGPTVVSLSMLYTHVQCMCSTCAVHVQYIYYKRLFYSFALQLEKRIGSKKVCAMLLKMLIHI